MSEPVCKIRLNRAVLITTIFQLILVFGVNAQDENKVYTDLMSIESDPLQVHKLDLSNQQLGKFPSSILSCTNLKELILNDTYLTSIPESIALLVNLETFEFNHLDSLNLEFKVMPNTMALLKQLKNVGLIGLPNLNWKEAMKTLQLLPELNNLAVMKNNFKTLPEGIEKLTSLEQIWLGGNTALDPQEVFDKLPFIKQVGFGGSHYTKLPDNTGQAGDLFNVWLSGNKLTSVIPLLNNSKLKSIALNSNQLKELPTGLTRLSIEVLLLDNNPDLDWDKVLTELGTMNSIRRLSLSNNRLAKAPEALVKLLKLQVLYLRGNEFDEGEKDTIRKLLPSTKVIF